VGVISGGSLVGSLETRWPLLPRGRYVSAVGGRALRPLIAQRGMLRRRGSSAAGGGSCVRGRLFGCAGPLAVAWLGRRLPDVHALRASTPVVIAVSACSVLLAMGWAGRLSQPDLWLSWLGLLGVAALGVLIGNRWARHVPPELLRKIVCGLLVVSGLTLAVHAIQQG